MAIDPAKLSPTQLVRLLNSTPLGPVINAAALHRQRNEAGMRIASDGDGKRIHLVRYAKWLVRELEKPAPAPTDYTDRLRRDLQRKLDASRQGRDIGPVPDVVDMERRERCEQSFRDFCETYFPAAFSLPWSQDHLRIIEKIERAVLEGGFTATATSPTSTSERNPWVMISGKFTVASRCGSPLRRSTRSSTWRGSIVAGSMR